MRRLLGFAAVLVLVIAAGCGSDDSNSGEVDPGGEPDETTSTQAPTDAVVPVRLDVQEFGPALGADEYTDYYMDSDTLPKTVDFSVPCGTTTPVTLTAHVDAAGAISGTESFVGQWLIDFDDEAAAQEYLAASGKPDCAIGSPDDPTHTSEASTPLKLEAIPADEAAVVDVDVSPGSMRLTTRTGAQVMVLQTDVTAPQLAQLLQLAFATDEVPDIVDDAADQVEDANADEAAADKASLCNLIADPAIVAIADTNDLTTLRIAVEGFGPFVPPNTELDDLMSELASAIGASDAEGAANALSDFMDEATEYCG